jgi:hypothetical protein
MAETESVGTIFAEITLDGKKFTTQLKAITQEGTTAAKTIENNFSNSGVNVKNALNSVLGVARQLAPWLIAAFSVKHLINYAKEATLLASRVETLGVVVEQVGRRAGYTASEMQAYVESVKKMNITTLVAQDSIIKMAQAEIDLSQAGKLARIAQDAAVIGNMDSSAAFQRMINGIRTGQTEILRNMGLQVMMDAAYRKYATTLHKTTEELTNEERIQARVNAVVEEGAKIQGVYEASMGSAGKVMKSLVRVTEEIKLSIGQMFSGGFSEGVMSVYEGLKDVEKVMNKMKESDIWKKLEVGVTTFARILAVDVKIAISGIWDILKVLSPMFIDAFTGAGIAVYYLAQSFTLILISLKDIALLVANAVTQFYHLAKVAANAFILIGQISTGQIVAAKDTWGMMEKDFDKFTDSLKASGDIVYGYFDEIVDAVWTMSGDGKKAVVELTKEQKKQMEENAQAARKWHEQQLANIEDLKKANKTLLEDMKRNAEVEETIRKSEYQSKEMNFKQWMIEQQRGYANKDDLIESQYQEEVKMARLTAENAKTTLRESIRMKEIAAEQELEIFRRTEKLKIDYELAKTVATTPETDVLALANARDAAKKQLVVLDTTLKETRKYDQERLASAKEYAAGAVKIDEALNLDLKAAGQKRTNAEIELAEERQKKLVELAIKNNPYDQKTTDLQIAQIKKRAKEEATYMNTTNDKMKVYIAAQKEVRKLILETAKALVDQKVAALAASAPFSDEYKNALIEQSALAIELKKAEANEFFNLEKEKKIAALSTFAAMAQAQADYYKSIGDYGKAEKFLIEKAKLEGEILEEQGRNQVEVEEKTNKQVQQIRDETLAAYVDNISKQTGEMYNMFQSIGALFAEGTKQSKAMMVASQAMIVVEKMLALFTAARAVAHAASTAKTWYEAIAAIAAVAGALANVFSSAGISFGGGGGGGSTPKLPESTVYGAKAGTESKSIENVAEILNDTYSMELNKLTDLNNSVKALGAGTADNASFLSSMANAQKWSTPATTNTGGSGYGSWSFTTWNPAWDPEGVAAATQRAQQELDLVFTDLENTFTGAAKVFDDVALSAKASALDISKYFVDPKWDPKKTGEENAKAYADAFNKAADLAAQDVFGSMINTFAKIGEGAYETAMRLTVDSAKVQNILEKTSLYYGQFINSSAAGMVEFSESLIKIAGGLDELQSSFENFYDAFIPDYEKQNFLLRDLREQFKNMNLTLPATRQGYANLVNGLNLTTKAGQEAYAALLQMSGAADQFYSYNEDLESKRLSLQAELAEATGDTALAEKVLQRQREIELQGMDEMTRWLQMEVWVAQDAQKASEGATEAQKSYAESLGMTEKQLSLTMRILELEGKSSEFLAMQRAAELYAMTDAEKALQNYIYTLEDAASAAEKASAIQNELNNFMVRLYQLQGNTNAANQITRAQELEAALTDENRAILRQIYALEDAKTAEEARNEALADAQAAIDKAVELEKQRKNLSIAILRELGKEEEALRMERAMALSELDESLRAQQEYLWSLQDYNAEMERVSNLRNEKLQLEIELLQVLGREQEATARQRESELAQMDESLRGLQVQIWAAEDAKEAMQKLSEAMKDAAERTKTLDQMLRDLSIGDQAPVQSLEAYQKEYDRLLQAASESADGLSAFQSFESQYLNFMKTFSSNYAMVVEKVKDDIESLYGTGTTGFSMEDYANELNSYSVNLDNYAYELSNFIDLVASGALGTGVLDSYAHGIQSVPQTGPYMLHQGETVVGGTGFDSDKIGNVLGGYIISALQQGSSGVGSIQINIDGKTIADVLVKQSKINPEYQKSIQALRN